jgi:hypothetical protein
MTSVDPSVVEFVVCAAAPIALITAAFGLLVYAFTGLLWDFG